MRCFPASSPTTRPSHHARKQDAGRRPNEKTNRGLEAWGHATPDSVGSWVGCWSVRLVCWLVWWGLFLSFVSGLGLPPSQFEHVCFFFLPPSSPRTEDALALFREAVDGRLAPSAVTCGALVSCCEKAGLPSVAGPLVQVSRPACFLESPTHIFAQRTCWPFVASLDFLSLIRPFCRPGDIRFGLS